MTWLVVLSTPVVIFWLLVAKLSLFLWSVSNDKGISFSSVKSEDGRQDSVIMENKTKTYANNQIVSSAFTHSCPPFDPNHTIRTGALVEDTAACVLLFTDLTTLDWEPMMSPSKSSRCWWLWSPVSLFSLSRATQNWAPISSSSLVLIWRPWRRGRCHSDHQKEKDSEIILKSQRDSHILIKKYIAMAAVDCLYREHKFAKNKYFMKTVKHNGLASTADFSQWMNGHADTKTHSALHYVMLFAGHLYKHFHENQWGS